MDDEIREAAEYLCKVGSNLKARSESLNKDLQNSHAVLKTVEKLLLICSQSKKSIQNVENMIYKVLNVCDVEANKKSSSEPPKYHIEYGSFKLRISRKIALKHYLSAKVTTKQLSADELDKYPVYYKCRLYEQRKRSAGIKKLKENNLDAMNEGALNDVDAEMVKPQKPIIKCVNINKLLRTIK